MVYAQIMYEHCSQCYLYFLHQTMNISELHETESVRFSGLLSADPCAMGLAILVSNMESFSGSIKIQMARNSSETASSQIEI